MCGIVGYWAKEATLYRKSLDMLFAGAARRGRDGVGVGIYTPQFGMKFLQRFPHPYNHCKDQVLDMIEETLSVGDILLVSCRATPETELETTEEMLQPIARIGTVLVHNGGITDSINKELSELSPPRRRFITDIDSEGIQVAYLVHGYNMVKTMEYLSGSFAFILIDMLKDKLYAVTSFNPLAHMYIKGYGYFLHSDLKSLNQVLRHITGASRDGMNVWESWYHHYIEGYTILETDLESGFQYKKRYHPNFLWPNKPKTFKNTKTLVIASGGIDSGLTAHILKLAGHSVEMVHFSYGQKGESEELWAVKHLAKSIGVPCRRIDLDEIYNVHNLSCGSMLTDNKIEITSGEDDLKSTIAWVPGRNAIFVSITMALAESWIMTKGLEKVYISAGWSQLSEETGGYPDNSFQFSQAINNLKDYGYITGDRIEFLPIMRNLTKTEEWALGYLTEFPFLYTVSCDNPRIHEGKPYLCMECGSTKMSCIAADRSGVPDMRHFIKDGEYIGQRETPTKESFDYSLEDLLDRLELTEQERMRIYYACRP